MQRNTTPNRQAAFCIQCSLSNVFYFVYVIESIKLYYISTQKAVSHLQFFLSSIFFENLTSSFLKDTTISPWLLPLNCQDKITNFLQWKQKNTKWQGSFYLPDSHVLKDWINMLIWRWHSKSRNTGDYPECKQ